MYFLVWRDIQYNTVRVDEFTPRDDAFAVLRAEQHDWPGELVLVGAPSREQMFRVFGEYAPKEVI